MSDHQDQEKVDAYLKILEERILDPVRVTGIRSYCSATLLLLFAAIDGLGKLLHKDERAGCRKRICATLHYMGDKYANRKEQLLSLRNALVHNVINVESLLSNLDIEDEQHLELTMNTGFIYVNTATCAQDVVGALARFRETVIRDPAILKKAADRLRWRTDAPAGPSSPATATPSPPPPVEFIEAKW